MLNEDIVKGLVRDSPLAMQKIYDHYYVPLCSFAWRYTGDKYTAEEVVSDVLYRIWVNRHSGYNHNTLREYLFTATRNTCINYVKQQSRRRVLSEKWADELRCELIDETPLDILITAELKSRINTLIEELPQQCRTAFSMSRDESMSYAEIAEEMDISVNTVKHHIKTALQKLRISLDRFITIVYILSEIIY